jgi:hypothetical protein
MAVTLVPPPASVIRVASETPLKASGPVMVPTLFLKPPKPSTAASAFSWAMVNSCVPAGPVRVRILPVR